MRSRNLAPNVFPHTAPQRMAPRTPTLPAVTNTDVLVEAPGATPNRAEPVPLRAWCCVRQGDVCVCGGGGEGGRGGQEVVRQSCRGGGHTRFTSTSDRPLTIPRPPSLQTSAPPAHASSAACPSSKLSAPPSFHRSSILAGVGSADMSVVEAVGTASESSQTLPRSRLGPPWSWGGTGLGPTSPTSQLAWHGRPQQANQTRTGLPRSRLGLPRSRPSDLASTSADLSHRLS